MEPIKLDPDNMTITKGDIRIIMQMHFWRPSF
jgi:hypothetical protein